jgi:predicted nucleotidyltransferase
MHCTSRIRIKNIPIVTPIKEFLRKEETEMKKSPLETAREFVERRYPTCRAAFLAGSVVRGQATDTSDLDIVVIDDGAKGSYRESFLENGWMIESFIHTSKTYRNFFESDRKRGRPSLPRMCREGIILKDDGIAERIRHEAKALLENGPDPWTEEDIRLHRYFITDLLMDFEGSNCEMEDLFIAGAQANRLHDFLLRSNGRWIGEGKWIARALKEYDESVTKKIFRNI